MTGRFQLGEWQVDPQVGTVTLGDQTATLEPKMMEVLVYLARHPDEVLSKEWILPDTRR